jgi:mono/diheme cytochrome c family protein
MRNPGMLISVVSAVFLASALDVALVAQAPAAKTVWDGVYTDAQAARAEGTFGATCARCHSLTPGAGQRPLVGDAFWQKNTQKTVGEVLTFVSTNMPNGQGGSLSASVYNDLVALILKSNGLPAGTVEITPEAVAKVMIIPKDGPGELPTNTLVRIVGCLAPKSGADWILTSATVPQRAEKAGAVAADSATQALGDRTFALKFVLGRIDAHIGKRMAVTGLLMGPGGANGINVSTVAPVADTCG